MVSANGSGRKPTLTAALAWARAGWPVLPCRPDKSPCIPKGKDAASRDPAQIRKWWAIWPYALVGGRTDGLVVLDLDSYKPGHKADRLSVGELPPTKTHSTLQGGTHLIYADPDNLCRSSKLGPNGTIDVRAGTSKDYVILPAPGTGYEVLDGRDPAPMPACVQQAVPVSSVTEESPDGPGLPDPLPAKLVKAMQARQADQSEHTLAVAIAAAMCDFTDEQIRMVLEHDLITTARRNERRRQQPNWWDDEFARVLKVARDKQQDWQQGKSTAAVLMRIAADHYDMGVADDGEPFALPRSGPLVVRLLRGDKYSLRAELSARYHDAHGSPPSNGALADVMTALEGKCQEVAPVPLPLRVARHGTELVLDLGDTTGRAVVIGPGGWKIVDRSPVLFRRTRLTRALPEPVRGHKLSATLLPFINVSREDWPLLAACLVAILWPDIPHPIPHLTGTEGVAKTATTRTLRNLIDPSSVPTRGKPDEKDWDVALSAQWVVALDNLSTIQPWLSDAMCRAVTGEGTVRRKLYTDTDMSTISVRRVMMINGISTEIANADLAGRTITFELERIEAYKDEVELAAAWDEAHPKALGALLDLAASVLQIAPEVKLPPIYRMADFARIVASLDQINGTRALAAYHSRLESAALDVLHGDPAGTALLEWARTLREPWEGTLAELEARLLRRYANKRPSGWPKTTVAWGAKMKRIGNPLRRAGIEVVKSHTRRGTVYTVSRTV